MEMTDRKKQILKIVVEEYVAARLSYFAESLGRMFGKNQLPPKEDQET